MSPAITTVTPNQTTGVGAGPPSSIPPATATIGTTPVNKPARPGPIRPTAATGLDTVIVTPAHQFPTGVVLAAPRRRALLDWARGARLIVEDDYDAEHRYDRAPVTALQALAPEHVVYTGSVSKTLAPALRLGWLLAPDRAARRPRRGQALE